MGIGIIQRQSILSLIWQISFTFLGLLSTMYFSHTIGASVLGDYFLFVAYLGILGLITDGGFGGAAIKRISEGEEQNEYFSASFTICCIFVSIVLIIVIIFRSYFIQFQKSGTYIWLLIALITTLFYSPVSYGVEGRGKMGIFTTCNFINNVSRTIIQVIAIFLGYGIAGMAGGFVIGLLVAGIIELRFFDLHFVHFKWRHIKSLSIFSFWLFLTSSGGMIFSYADIVLIGHFLKDADVGIYRIALQFATFGTFTAQAILPTLLPKVSRWSKTGEFGLIEESLSKAFSYSLMLVIPVLAGGILLGDKLLYFLYGSEFMKGYNALVIILVLQVVNVFMYCFGTYLGSLDHQKDSFKATGVSAVVNILLNFILIPKIGIIGAAISTLISMSLNTFLAWRILRHIIKVRLDYNSLLNFVKASITMTIFVIGYRLIVPLTNIWVTLLPVAIGGIIYLMLILKFDERIYEELTTVVTQMNLKMILK
jgi:O-antigen/teichoic acid export membrane protein